MAETTEQQPKEYRDVTAADIRVSDGGGGDFPEYVKLEADEPYKAHITKLKLGEKFNRTSGKDEDRLYVWFEVDEGEGKGQVYRGDFNPVVTTPSVPKKSNLAVFLEKVYGEPQTGVDPVDIIGRPLRIELSEPWGDKGLQFAKAFKAPKPDQKKVSVEQVQEDVVLDELPDEKISAEELDKMFP